MKTDRTLHLQATACYPRVKELLMKVIIFLTSQNFAIFATSIGALIAYVAAVSESYRLAADGALIFITGFAPMSLREVVREIRRDRQGIQTKQTK